MSGEKSWHRQMVFIYAIFIILVQCARKCSKHLKSSSEAKGQKSPPPWSSCSRTWGSGLGGTVTKKFFNSFYLLVSFLARLALKKLSKLWSSAILFPHRSPCSAVWSFGTRPTASPPAPLPNCLIWAPGLVNWISSSWDGAHSSVCFSLKSSPDGLDDQPASFDPLLPPCFHPSEFAQVVSFSPGLAHCILRQRG